MKRAVFLLTALLLALSAAGAQASRDEHDDDDDHGRRHRTSSAKFYGTVDALPPAVNNGVWWVNGREVKVSPQTKIKEKRGRVAVGAYVEVEGYFSGSGLAADEIEVKGRRR
ncbi:DUF5666 domain-containing protein [Candidatus Electronema sp. JC]|jgi:hypothetical protein|uniref:DUF5666 domain-containing protein n=1 Tax=Candidatus Electronema sp. JC TaxID=3401570 RepID=UPI003B43935C